MYHFSNNCLSQVNKYTRHSFYYSETMGCLLKLTSVSTLSVVEYNRCLRVRIFILYKVLSILTIDNVLYE